MTDVQLASHLGPNLSFIVAWTYTALVLAAFVVCVARVRSYNKRGAQARAAHDPDDSEQGWSQLLSPGPTIVAGAVEYAKGEEQAVRVEITQEAEEYENSGSYSHKWIEKEREVSVRPFYLRLANGLRVRVEATKELFLVDDMDGVVFYNTRKRDRIVELVVGEEVTAEGVLHRDHDPEGKGSGYRDTRGWVLRPAGGGRISISSHPLEMRFKRWASFYRKFALLAFVMLAVGHMALSHYHLATWKGRVATATVKSKRHFTTSCNEGSTCHHYELKTKLPWGARYVAEINRSGWSRLTAGSKVPVLHVRRGSLQYGARSTVGYWALFIGGTLLVLVAIMFTMKRRGHHAWFEGDVVDKSGGRIAKNTGLSDPM